MPDEPDEGRYLRVAGGCGCLILILCLIVSVVSVTVAFVKWCFS